MSGTGAGLRRRIASRGPAPWSMSLRRQRTITSIVLLSPAMLLWGLVFLAPLILMVWMSLNLWPLFGNIRFTGFDNYAEALTDAKFRDSVAFTVKYTLIITPIQIVGGYLLAALVRDRWRGVGAFRSVYFMPVVIGFAAAAFVFLSLIQPGYGLIDGLLDELGIKSQDAPSRRK